MGGEGGGVGSHCKCRAHYLDEARVLCAAAHIVLRHKRSHTHTMSFCLSNRTKRGGEGGGAFFVETNQTRDGGGINVINWEGGGLEYNE